MCVRRLIRRIRPCWASWLAIATVVGLLAWGTYRRNAMWADPVAFWKNEVAGSPLKARPHMNLALVYIDRGDLEKAREEILKGFDLAPELRVAYEEEVARWKREGMLVRVEPEERREPCSSR